MGFEPLKGDGLVNEGEVGAVLEKLTSEQV